MNHFSQLLNVYGVNDVRKTEILTAEPLVPQPSAFEAEMTIEKLKRQNCQVLIKSQQKLLDQRVRKFALRSINLWSLFWIRRNYLRSGRSRPLYLFTRRVIIVIIEAYHFLSVTWKILSNILLSSWTPYAEKITGDHQCGFWSSRSTTDQIFLHSSKSWEKWE